ncbi:MAG TPA: glycosyltransferase family A protein, partial [Chloroflexota bacterium]|nr:glycosyltransferase family A protein [Chloroflexota bacterium]
RALWATRQMRRLESEHPLDGDAHGLPGVSVIVPARNEERTIDVCLDGIRAQKLRQPELDLEAIVVDDRSDDRTAEIVRRRAAAMPYLDLIAGADLPLGWIGKCWALQQGAGAATKEWLLFVDADTRLFAGAVAAAVAEAQRRRVDVLSVLTHQQLPTAWEKVIMPAVFGALAEALPVEFVNNPRLPQFALANGQFLLVRREAYQRLGGHASVKKEIGEDTRFAQRAKQLGIPFWLGDGRQLATTRMYHTPAALWEGWTKNLHTGVRLLPWVVPPGIVFYVLALALPYWLVVRGRRERASHLTAHGLAQLGALLYLRRLTDLVYGVPPAYTLTQPLGHAAFLALLGGSFFKVLSGRGVTWKGRRYVDA